MASKIMLETAGHFKWYHWGAGFVAAGALNAGILAGLVKTYKWTFSNWEEKTNDFIGKYGRPNEAQRLQVYTWIAPKYDEMMELVEKGGADVYRKEHLASAKGDVLEVAVGTARSLDALGMSTEVKSYVGLDVNEAMLFEAKKKIGAAKFPARLVQGNAHALPFPDNSFDTVVGSLCLCSVEEPVKALDEMARVCRPGGKVLLVEPGLSCYWVMRASQRHLDIVPNPLHAWEYGYRDDLDVPETLSACKTIEVASAQSRGMGNWYLISAHPPQVE